MNDNPTSTVMSAPGISPPTPASVQDLRIHAAKQPEHRAAPGPASRSRSPRPSARRFAAERADGPALVIGPMAWLKLMLFLHIGDTEVGGFGISRGGGEDGDELDLLYLEDFATVRQRVTAISVALDDAAVADYFDDRVDAGLPPARFGRVWVHTHPGDSPDPSMTDEETFARVFGTCDWAVMLIVSRTGRTYCRLSFSAGPGGTVLLPVRIDWPAWPDVLLRQAVDLTKLCEGWIKEYGTNVEHILMRPPLPNPDRRPSCASDTALEEDVFGLFDPDADEVFAEHERLALLDRFAELFEGSAAEEVAP